MNLVSLFEHEALANQLSDAEKLSDAEMSTLDRLRGPSGEKVFDVGWREVKATSFVGVVQLGRRVVQVLPKMHETGLRPAECEREATANLLFLLSYTGKLRVTEPEISRLT